MALETSLWSWLSKVKLQLRERVDLRRVEDSTGAGFPDVDGFALFWTGALGAIETHPFGFKLELKSHVRPKKPETPVRFALEGRDRQIEFMRKRYAMGEAAYFFLQVGAGSDRMFYLAPGDAGARLKAGINESELAILCATENGMVFDGKTKQFAIIEGIQKCFKRRRLP